jgi:hypothetical protein
VAPGQTVKIPLQVELSEGDNTLEVSCLTANGIESIGDRLQVKCASNTRKPNLYFIGLSISKFQNPNYNLRYTIKDCRNLLSLLQSNQTYGTISIDTFFDTKANLKSLAALHPKLKKSSVDDIVILFISGHGFLDTSYNLIFPTAGNTFESNSDLTGIPFDSLTALLEGIPARRKVMLVDACHSGPVEEPLAGKITANKLPASNEPSKNAKGKALADPVDNYKRPNLDPFELMQDLFEPTTDNTGIVVIAASSGNKVAYESHTLQNGIFTSALKGALQNHKTMGISELKRYMENEVVRLSENKQKPVIRQDNRVVDFQIW